MLKKTVSVAEFGAVSGNSNQTAIFQKAVDHCFLSGGGEVCVPAGEYIIAGLRLRSNVTLHLLENAVIRGTRNPEDYTAYLNDEVEPISDKYPRGDKWEPAYKRESNNFITSPCSRWNNGLIKAIEAENIAIIGEKGSVINGMDCFDEQGEENYRGPHAINFFYCKNITLRGYTVKNSANWAHNISFSENITADDITVLAGHDGIHMSVCDNIRLSGCKFYTGDDCIAGFDNNDVEVENCILNSACSAFRFGGNNVKIRRCFAYGPCKYIFRGMMPIEDKKACVPSGNEGSRTNMLSFFTYYSDKSLPIRKQPGDIYISDCVVDNADRLVHYNCSGNEPWQSARALGSIHFENLAAMNIGMSLNLYSTAETPIAFSLKNSVVSFRENAKAGEFIRTHSYSNISLENLCIANLHADTLIKSWGNDGKLYISDIVSDIKKENYLTAAEEPFVCKAI